MNETDIFEKYSIAKVFAKTRFWLDLNVARGMFEIAVVATANEAVVVERLWYLLIYLRVSRNVLAPKKYYILTGILIK